MNSRRFVRIIAPVLIVISLLPVVSTLLGVDGSSASATSTRTTKEQIDKLRNEKWEYELQKREIQSRINTIEFERSTEITKKGILDDRIMLTGLEIDNITKIIENYAILIREKEYEVVVAQSMEDEQFFKYKSRVRDMEENGIITYLELVFDSTSFADLLARVDFVADIMRADEKAYNDYIDARNETIAAKEALEEAKSEMEDEKLNLEQKEIELFEQLEEATAIIIAMEQTIEAEQALRAMVAEEEDRIQKEINAKVEELRKQEEAQRAREAAQRARRGSGELMWPANGRFASAFGMRRHPVFKIMRMHNGIDIGAPHGANVFAADSGTVIISAYNSGYGNYIVLNHGNGMTTLYAHLSKRGVNVGTSVTKGQVIGLIGSTGVSTGPHLHFEVSVNGSRINPMLKL